LDEPDVSVEVGDRGVYVGPEAVKTLFGKTFSNTGFPSSPPTVNVRSNLRYNGHSDAARKRPA